MTDLIAVFISATPETQGRVLLFLAGLVVLLWLKR